MVLNNVNLMSYSHRCYRCEKCLTELKSNIAAVQSLSCVWLFVNPWTAARQCCLLLGLTVCSNSCPFCPWCHPTISFFISPFSSCPQYFPASGSFPVSQIGKEFVSASASDLASLLPMNIQGWFPLGLTGLISSPKGFSRVFSSTTIWKHQFFSAQPSLWSNFHTHTWLLEKPWTWLDGPLSAKWCLCCFIRCLGLL